MTEASPEPPAGTDTTNTIDTAETADAPAQARWRFISDVLVLQLKLVLGNLYTLVLIPATLGAAALDLLFKTERHGERFYRVLGWGRRAEETIGLYNALDRGEESLRHDFTVDVIVSQIEAVVAREYAKGGTAASVKAAVDHALDNLHATTDKGAAKARAAAQRLAEKIRPPGSSA